MYYYREILRMDSHVIDDVPFIAQIEDIQKYILDFEKLKKNNNYIVNGNGHPHNHNSKSIHNFLNYTKQNQSHLNQYKNCYQNFFYSSRNPRYKGNIFLNSSKGGYSNTNDNFNHPSNSKLKRNLFNYDLRNNKNSENNTVNNNQLGSKMSYNSIQYQNLTTPNQFNNIYPRYCSNVSNMNTNNNINNFRNFQYSSDWDKDEDYFDSKKALMVKSLYDTYSHDVITNKFDPYQPMNADHNAKINYNNNIHYSVSANNSSYLNNTQQSLPTFPTEHLNDKVDFLMTNSNLIDRNTLQYDINSLKKDTLNLPLNNRLIEKSYLNDNFTNPLSPISSSEAKFNSNISPVSSKITIPTNDSMTYMNNSSRSTDLFMSYPSNLYTNSSSSHYYNDTNKNNNQEISLLQQNIYDYKNRTNDSVSNISFRWDLSNIKGQNCIKGNDTNKNISLPNLNKSFKIWNDDMKVWS